MKWIEFAGGCEASPDDRNYIINTLPKKKTKVVKVETVKNLLHIHFYTQCRTIDEAKAWIAEFQDNTKTTYSIKTTRDTTGRYVLLKQYLYCHCNTRTEKLYDASQKINRTRNTNCPSNMSVTLHAIKKRYKGKNDGKFALLKELPCEITLILTHNHNTDSADALRFRKVSFEVKEKLLRLFKNGHSPTTALETLKTEIYVDNDEYERILSDRRYCPNYDYCYRLYRKEFKSEYGPFDFSSEGKEFLKTKLKDYNLEVEDNCAEIAFHESDYVICICPPLFKRVHKYISSASEMVFMDSSRTLDHDGSRIFVLLTDSECGGLPLGAIITSSASVNIIAIGLQLLKSMVGNTIFGGYPDGAAVFLTDDFAATQTALNSVFPRSKCLLCVFHVLQSVWRWLRIAKNQIPRNQQDIYFNEFKSVIYANTEKECFEKYEIAKNSAAKHESYYKYLEEYWNRRECWALAYRTNIRSNDTNNFSEAIMGIIKDKLLGRVKAFNIVQLVDFVLTKFVNYYETRLLDAANDRLRKNFLGRAIKLPPAGILEKIQILTDSVILVPSETKKDLVYIVNIDVLVCSCFQGNAGIMCKHIDWACISVSSKKYNTAIDSQGIRKMFYSIATGREAPDSRILALSEMSRREEEEAVNAIPDINSINSATTDVDEQQYNTTSTEEIKERGRAAIEKFSKMCAMHMEKSPTDVVLAFEKMCEKTEKLPTTSAFISSCSTFGAEYNPKRNRSMVPIPCTAVSRRKPTLSIRKRHVNERPRKTSASVKLGIKNS